MTQEQVTRYIDLVHRRTKLLAKGSWDEEEMETIGQELTELRKLADEEHEKRQKRARAYFTKHRRENHIEVCIYGDEEVAEIAGQKIKEAIQEENRLRRNMSYVIKYCGKD